MPQNLMQGALDSIKSIIAGASKPERSEPGPGDVGPTVQTKDMATGKPNLVTLPMTPAECQEWWNRIDRAVRRRKTREEKWSILLNEYLPIISKSGEAETVKVMQHFRNVHSKIGSLFYRDPDLILSPKDPSPLNAQMPNPMSQPGQQPLPPLTMEDVVSIKQAVLKDKLGRDGIKVSRLMDELLFDDLAWAGFGASKLGYRCVYRPVPDMPAAQAAPGSILGDINPTPAPAQQAIPVPVYEEWYWRRFSPKKALWNDDLRSTRFDEDATWMGMEFFMSPKAAMKAFGLTEEEANKAAEDDRVHEYAEDSDVKGPGLVHGYELWPKASFFTDEVHPQAINQLVLIEGIKDKPLVWRPSPDQTFDETGRLTRDSLIGFPIRILTIRDMADSSFPWADSAYTNSEIKQLSTWRRQSIQLRDVAIGKYLYDTSVFDETEIANIKNADVGAYIGLQAGSLQQGADKVFTTTAQLHQTQDDYRNQQILQSDINETLGISANGAGSFTDTVRSATESANVQTNMQGRNDKELHRTLEFYIDGARMVDQLLMRYADEGDYVEITGQDGAKRIQLWNSQLISGRFLYDIAPDSMLRIDTAKDFQLFAQYWNLVAKSPLTNQPYILRRFARLRGLDPAKAVLPQAPPPNEPDDKLKVNLALKGEDLANPLVIKMLVDNKIISPQDAMLNQPPPPKPPEGAADKAPVISQHTASNSGGRENAPGSSNFREGQAKD